jgi:YbbR domain-containing protein
VRRLFTENLGLKGLSMALALLLWFVIAGETTSEMGLQVPLEMQNFPKDLELTGDAVDSVEVRLRASPGVIHALGPGQVSAQIDLKGAGEGERILQLTPESIRVPFGVSVVKINPSILTLNFERTLQKIVLVRPRLTGRPAAGFEVGEVTSDPAEVMIAGPKSRVQEIESAFTEPIRLDAARSTLTEAVNLGLEDPFLRIQGSPRVEVTARIRPLQVARSFDGVPVEVRGGQATLRPASVRLVVEGPSDAVAKVRPQDLKAYVDLAHAASGRASVAVEIAAGLPGVSLKAALPGEVAALAVKLQRSE